MTPHLRPFQPTGGFTLIEVMVSTTILNVSAKIKQVTVVVTPTGNALMLPVTTVFRRTISGNGNPLKTP